MLAWQSKKEKKEFLYIVSYDALQYVQHQQLIKSASGHLIIILTKKALPLLMQLTCCGI